MTTTVEKCGPCERGETTEVYGFPVHLCDETTPEWMYAGWCPCCGQLPTHSATEEGQS